ncbi:uncharacterized protein [Amphiura filiformis]|uniref:uncharacterized protein n=1 Tax=Amphiura filiformis TaxID=82378 RepID=UPI003B20EA13
MTDEKTPIWQDNEKADTKGGDVGATGGEPFGSGAIYHDSTQSPKARALLIGFVGITTAMVIVALSLCISQGVQTGQHGFLYFLIGLCLVFFIAVEIILIKFIKSGDLAKEKAWFLYFVGFCILLESIFTDVLVMN